MCYGRYFQLIGWSNQFCFHYMAWEYTYHFRNTWYSSTINDKGNIKSNPLKKLYHLISSYAKGGTRILILDFMLPFQIFLMLTIYSQIKIVFSYKLIRFDDTSVIVYVQRLETEYEKNFHKEIFFSGLALTNHNASLNRWMVQGHWCVHEYCCGSTWILMACW